MHILRNTLLFLVPIMITTSGLAQIKTFNKRLHLGQRTMVLGALHATDTAYYATGIVVDTVTPGSNTAALFLKFDLEGNPLDMKIIADSTRTYETWLPPLLPTRDGGFAVIGYSYTPEGRRGLLVKYDAEGDTLFTRTYRNYKPHLSEFIHTWDLVEAPEGGYFVTFVGSDTLIINEKEFVYNGNLLLGRLSEDGTLLWRKAFETPLRHTGGALLLTKDNKLVLCTGQFNKWAHVMKGFVSRLWLMKTDTSGVVEWEYLSPEEELYFSAFDMLEEEDGSLILATGKGTEYEYNQRVHDLFWDGCIMKMTAQGEKEWEVVFHGLQGPHYEQFFRSMVAAPDGSGYLAVASTFQSNYEENGWDQLGWLCKASPQGDSLWCRTYAVVKNPSDFHVLHDIRPTPDGGYLMCGVSRIGTYHPDTLTQATQQGWLIKVDQYGCLVPGCQIIDEVEQPGAASSRLKLYPNPASDYLHVFFHPGEAVSAGQFRVVDAHGRIMATFDSLPGETTYLLSLDGYSPGVYFLQYLEKGGMTRAEPFVVNNK